MRCFSYGSYYLFAVRFQFDYGAAVSYYLVRGPVAGRQIHYCTFDRGADLFRPKHSILHRCIYAGVFPAVLCDGSPGRLSALQTTLSYIIKSKGVIV